MKKQLFLLISILVSGLVFGQSPHIELLKIFKNKKGVEVNTIYQDSKGYVWIGTNSGLVKYDGVEFISIDENQSLSNSHVTCIIDDSSGTLWFGHKNGLITQSNGTDFWLFDPEEGLGSREISSFYIDNDQNLWFSTLGEGAYCYKGKRRKRLYNLNVDDGLLDDYVYVLSQHSDGKMYLGTDKGISIYDAPTKKIVGKITMTNGLPDNIVKQIILLDNVLWIGMEDSGICTYDLVKQQFIYKGEWDFGSINSFKMLNENELWVSSKRKGIIKCEYKNNEMFFSAYRKENGLADVRTKTVFIDREDNVWMGTRKGLSIRRNNFIEFFDQASGFNIKQVFSITSDSMNNFWIASQNGLFVVSKNAKGKLYTQQLFSDPEFQFTTFISIYTDVDGFIWAGTYGMGVYKINPSDYSYALYDSGNGLANDNVIHITGNENELWFSTLGGGVSIFNRKNEAFENLNVQNGLPSDYIYYSYLDKDKTVWLASDGGGVVKLIDKQLTPLNHPLMDSLGKVVYSITGSGDGVLWFNIVDQGLLRLENDECTHVTELNDLISNSVQGLIVSNNDELIVTSDLGISVIDCANLDVRNIAEEAGLASQQPNLNAIYKDNKDNVFVGTANGMVKLISHSLKNANSPKLYITNISLYDEVIDADRVVFKHNENYISFDYVGLWYSSSQPLQYRFKLNGYDLDWRDATSSRSFTYSNLPSGEYQFVVEVKVPNGDWFSGNDAQYSFQIKLPFWKTPLFILFVIALGAFGVYMYIYNRTKKLQSDKRLLEAEVHKRTAEIRKQKEEIEEQRNFVVQQRDKIEHQNKDIRSSIHYASRIQRAVLPPEENFKNSFNNYFLFFRPRDIVSGDFYYLNEKHDKIIVAAADSTGHGVPGAFMSMLGASLLNQIVSQLKSDFNAANILTELRDHVKTSLRQTGQKDEAKDGMDMSLCVIEKSKNKVHFSGAFNPLFLVRNKEPMEFKGDKMPIGVYIVESDSFTNHEIEVQEGDMLYMYSDGFQDQFGGEKNRKFLPKNLRQLLLDNSHLEPQLQEKALNDAFMSWKKNENQVDDVLVIGIKI